MIRLLKVLSALAVVAAVAWVGWWYLAARGQEAALEQWFEARAAEGWQAEHSGIAIDGFPNRFHRRIEAPALADPDAGWAWQAPFLDLDSPAADPTLVDATFAERQIFALPIGRADIAARRMTARLALRPVPALTLREGRLDMDDLVLTGRAGWRAGASRLAISVARREIEGEPENTHAVSSEARGVVLPQALVAQLDPAGVLSPMLDAMTVSGLVVPDRPLDRAVVEDGRIGFETIVLRSADLDWDGMGIAARGRLDADTAGYAEGALEIELRDWRRLMTLARNAGAVPDQMVDALEGALELIAFLGRSDTLDVTIRFDQGRARIGPVVIGESFRMRPAG